MHPCLSALRKQATFLYLGILKPIPDLKSEKSTFESRRTWEAQGRYINMFIMSALLGSSILGILSLLIPRYLPAYKPSECLLGWLPESREALVYVLIDPSSAASCTKTRITNTHTWSSSSSLFANSPKIHQILSSASSATKQPLKPGLLLKSAGTIFISFRLIPRTHWHWR